MGWRDVDGRGMKREDNEPRRGDSWEKNHTLDGQPRKSETLGYSWGAHVTNIWKPTFKYGKERV